MNERSQQRLNQMHPELARRVRVLCERLAARGITVEVVQGLRSFAEQDKLFAQGRTAPGKIVTRARGGQSNHNFGLAVDLCPFVNGKPDWNASPAIWQQIGNQAERLGLEWGGNWKFVDLPHVQLSAMSVAQCRTLYNQGGLPLVWQRASAAVVAIESPAPPRLTANPPSSSKPTPSEATAVPPTLQATQIRDVLPEPQAWQVTASPVRSAEVPRPDSRKSVWAVLLAALGQIFATITGWWQNVDRRLLYVALMIGLTLIGLAYLYRQIRLGVAREERQ